MNNFKKCAICRLDKDINIFGKLKSSKDGLRRECKDCRKKNYDTNRDFYIQQKRNDHQKHKIKRNQKCKEYYNKNKQNLRKKGREYYYKNHADLRKKMNLYSKEYKNRPLVKIAERLRNRMRACVKLYNLDKKDKTLEYLGCNISYFVSYLESLFLEGMTWENYGFGNEKWVIDHIKPLCSFNLTNQEEIYKACNYTNLRPFWWKDNSEKASKDKELSVRI